jgi:hypothetical protein
VIQWITAGALATGRTAHTATLLPNGKVLVSGGHDGFRTVYSSCELYDPATDRWSPAADMIQPRTGHTATLLPNGKVLVAGGFTDTFSEVLATCELYDPATDTWSRTGLMNSRHGYHSATLLANGKVLVVSGTDGEININFGNILLTQTCEIYDPVSGNWSATASLSERPFPVSRPTFDNTNTPLVTLPDGRVLLATHIQGVAGGGLTLVPYCQIFDPQREAWTPAAAFYEMGGRWVSPQGLTLLPNGQVLLVRGAYEGKADVYNPAANAWNRIGDNLTLPNGFAIVLNDGKVLLAGSRGTPFHQSVVLDPRTGSAYNPGNIRDRAYHAATRLPNGYVLITGGLDRFNRPTTDCQIFVPAR